MAVRIGDVSYVKNLQQFESTQAEKDEAEEGKLNHRIAQLNITLKNTKAEIERDVLANSEKQKRALHPDRFDPSPQNVNAKKQKEVLSPNSPKNGPTLRKISDTFYYKFLSPDEQREIENAISGEKITETLNTSLSTLYYNNLIRNTPYRLRKKSKLEKGLAMQQAVMRRELTNILGICKKWLGKLPPEASPSLETSIIREPARITKLKEQVSFLIKEIEVLKSPAAQKYLRAEVDQRETQYREVPRALKKEMWTALRKMDQTIAAAQEAFQSLPADKADCKQTKEKGESKRNFRKRPQLISTASLAVLSLSPSPKTPPPKTPPKIELLRGKSTTHLRIDRGI